MTLNEGIEKLKSLIANFNAEKPVDEVPATPENVSENFKDVKLVDGVTIVSYDGDMPMQGMPLFTVTSEGRLPAADGEYELEDGSSIVVVGGLIAEVKTVDAPVEPADAAAPADAPAAPVSNAPAANGEVKPKRVIKSQVEEHVFNAFKEEVEAKFKALEEKFAAEKKELEDKNTKLQGKLNTAMEFNSELTELVKKIADAPSSEPTEKIAKPFDVKAARMAFKEDLNKLQNQK